MTIFLSNACASVVALMIPSRNCCSAIMHFHYFTNSNIMFVWLPIFFQNKKKRLIMLKRLETCPRLKKPLQRPKWRQLQAHERVLQPKNHCHGSDVLLKEASWSCFAFIAVWIACLWTVLRVEFIFYFYRQAEPISLGWQDVFEINVPWMVLKQTLACQ